MKVTTSTQFNSKDENINLCFSFHVFIFYSLCCMSMYVNELNQTVTRMIQCPYHNNALPLPAEVMSPTLYI